MTEDRRRLFSHHQVDGVDHLSINVKKWTGVLGFVGAVIATSVTIAGLVLALLHPVVTRWIHEETRPAHLEMGASIIDLQRELEEVRREAATKAEFDARMIRVENRLDDIYRLLAGGNR